MGVSWLVLLAVVGAGVAVVVAVALLAAGRSDRDRE